ncbi:MAG: hypothetical protein ACLP00_10255 [Terracidiphilus sp.]
MPAPLLNPSAKPNRAASCVKNAPFQVDVPGPLRIWHLTSLDAPAVAVVWSFGFAWAAGVHLPLWVPVLLALGTWVVYIGDRLLDARIAIRSGDLSSLRDRHFFHWRHRRVFAPLACCASAVAIAIVFSLMPPAIRERNSVLAFAALAYFSRVHLPHAHPKILVPLRSKEFLVGVLFTAGCAFPSFVRIHAVANFAVSLWPFLLVVTFFAALAWLNCSAIDRWESSEATGNSTAAFALAAIGLISALVLFPYQPHDSALFLAGSASAFLLALFDIRRSRLTPLALRCAADLVLLTPILCIAR